MTAHRFEWNPIVVREYRARWRGWGAFALLFGYAAILASALFWSYADASGKSNAPANPLQRMEVLGATLFTTLIWMQSFAWSLIGPAITATSIAGEREDGMLEAMQLSPLAPAKIVGGKLLSSLSFMGLLLLVSLPITATCFLMGGVSPEDFLAALALHAATAFFGASLGLWCSAWSRRANAALRSAYVLAIAWLIGSAISFGMMSFATVFGGKFGSVSTLFFAIIGWSNPIIATAAISDSGVAGAASFFAGWGIIEDSPWMICIIFQLVLSAVLLYSATRAVLRPFGEQYWMNPKQILEVPPTGSTPEATNPAGSTPGANSPTLNPERGTRNRDWMLIPIFSQLRFLNPVLQRETRAKFRMRQPPAWVLAFEVLLALAVAYYYLGAMYYALFVPDQREMIWWIINFVGLSVVAISSAVSGANSFTREREIRTWESLRMSLLSPRQIIGAKLGAVCIGMAVFSLPFWPLLLPCIRYGFGQSAGLKDGVTMAQAILSFGIIAATGICYTLWGMFWSWRCRRTSGAVGWTLGSLFFVLVFLPSFLTLGFNFSTTNNEDLILSYHPFVSLAFTGEDKKMGTAAASIYFLLVASAILWRRLEVMLSRERE